MKSTVTVRVPIFLLLIFFNCFLVCCATRASALIGRVQYNFVSVCLYCCKLCVRVSERERECGECVCGECVCGECVCGECVCVCVCVVSVCVVSVCVCACVW